MDGGKVFKILFEMVVRGWCRWMRVPTIIVTGVAAIITRTAVCVKSLLESVCPKCVSTVDLKAFRSSGFAALAQ